MNHQLIHIKKKGKKKKEFGISHEQVDMNWAKYRG